MAVRHETTPSLNRDLRLHRPDGVDLHPTKFALSTESMARLLIAAGIVRPPHPDSQLMVVDIPQETAADTDARSSRPSKKGIMGFVTLVISSGFLSACSAYINAQVEQKVITGDTTLSISGVPSNVTEKLSSDCTSVTITEGADRINSINVAADFQSVRVSPRSGVEGPVSGTASVGHKDIFGCTPDANIPFSGQVDTHPTTCQEVAAQGPVAKLSCDGDGVILDQNNQQIAMINGGAADVQMGANKELTVIVRDSGGNQTSASLATATNCVQQGSFLNQETGKVMTQIACDGPGMVQSASGASAAIVNGQAVLPATAQAQEQVVVNHNGFQTTFVESRPVVAAPVFNVGDATIRDGQVQVKVTCTTGFQDACNVQVGPAQVNVKGDGKTPAQIAFNEPVGAVGQVVPMRACDTIGDCSPVTNGQMPAYQPFGPEDAVEAVQTGPHTIAGKVNKHDRTNSIGNISITGKQEMPFRDSPVGRSVLSIFKSDTTVSCRVTGANDTSYSFECVLPFSHGAVHLESALQEKGGVWGSQLTAYVGVPDYSGPVQQLVEASPYLGLGTVALAIVGEVVLIFKKMEHDRFVENTRRAMAIINSAQPVDPLEKQRLDEAMGKRARKKDKTALRTLSMLEQRVVLQEIATDNATQRGPFHHKNVTRYMSEFAAQDDAALEHDGYRPFVQMREATKEELFWKLDSCIAQFEGGLPGAMVIPNRPREREEMGDFLMGLYEMKSDSWFWKQTKKNTMVKPRGGGHARAFKEQLYPHLTRESLRSAIVHYYAACGMLDLNRTRIFNVFNPVGQQMQFNQEYITQLASRSRS